MSESKTSRIHEIERLVEAGGDENITMAIASYKRMCLEPSLPVHDRYFAFLSFNKHIPDEGQDMLVRWRDMIPFLKGETLDSHLALLCRIVRSPQIKSHERVFTAVTLYNRAFYLECYGCFADLAYDPSLNIDHRVESCRFLFGSDDDVNKATAQECLIDIVDTNAYPSEYRYKIIAGYIARTGIATMLNSSKLRVAYDEEFVHGLQMVFFFNSTSGVRERILSGQHILGMECASETEKSEVSDELFSIANDVELKHEVRADAADVLMRLTTDPTRRTKAREIIAELGDSGVDETSTNMMDRVKTIYTNAENVHDEHISECVEKFVEKIVGEHCETLQQYGVVHDQAGALIRDAKLDPEKRHRAYKALNRVSIDTATFTKYKVTIAEIFTHVWARIQLYDDVKQKILESRLVEELVDMGDTCSSGHTSRFVNVLSEYDTSLKISWGSQIKANMVGRMTARMRDVKDEDLRGSIAMGMMDGADEEDRTTYIGFIRSSLEELYVELQKEFVGGGFIRDYEFDLCFSEGKKAWDIGSPSGGGEEKSQ